MNILPIDVLNRIFEYDGRIKYKPKEGIFVNIIRKDDYRYGVVQSHIERNAKIVKKFANHSNSIHVYIDVYYKRDFDEVDGCPVSGLVFCKKRL